MSMNEFFQRLHIMNSTGHYDSQFTVAQEVFLNNYGQIPVSLTGWEIIPTQTLWQYQNKHGRSAETNR